MGIGCGVIGSSKHWPNWGSDLAPTRTVLKTRACQAGPLWIWVKIGYSLSIAWKVKPHGIICVVPRNCWLSLLSLSCFRNHQLVAATSWFPSFDPTLEGIKDHMKSKKHQKALGLAPDAEVSSPSKEPWWEARETPINSAQRLDIGEMKPSNLIHSWFFFGPRTVIVTLLLVFEPGCPCCPRYQLDKLGCCALLRCDTVKMSPGPFRAPVELAGLRGVKRGA